MTLDTASIESRSNAEVQTPQPPAVSRRLKPAETIERWHGLYSSACALLRAPAGAQFPAMVGRLDDELVSLVDTEPEASLLLLIHEAGNDLQRYSCRHSLLVTVICELTARGLPEFDAVQRRSLRQAALTMNIGMTRLQDELALQDTSVTPEQRAEIQVHAAQGQEMLRGLGVDDRLWLEAVLRHHDAPPGPLADQPPPCVWRA